MSKVAYIDQNCLISLAQQTSAHEIKHLLRDIQEADLKLALSPVHWFETARSADSTEALRIAEFMDSLGTMWLRDRRDLQRREVRAFAAGKPGNRDVIDPICLSASQVVGDLSLLRGSYPIVSSRRIVAAFQRDRAHLASMDESYKKNEEGFSRNVGSVRDGKLTSQKEKDIWLSYLRSIAQEEPVSCDGLESAERKCFPAVVAEFEIAKEHWARGVRNPSMRLSPRRLSDVFHVVVAIPYVDYVISNDHQLRNLVQTVRPRLPSTVAEPMMSLEELIAAGTPPRTGSANLTIAPPGRR